MNFDPTIFLSMNADTINDITNSIMELQNHPDFILVLFESIKDPRSQHDTILTNITAQIRMSIATHWNTDFWDAARKREIITLLITNLFALPPKFRDVFVDLFTVIPSLDEQDIFWIEIIYNLIDQHQDAQEMSSIVRICLIWLKTIRDRPIDEANQQFLTNFFAKFIAAFEFVANSDILNVAAIPFTNTFIRFMTLLIRISNIPILSGSLDFIINSISPVLRADNSSNEIVQLKTSVAKFYSILIQLFYSKPRAETISATEERISYAEHFKAEVVSVIINIVKEICVIPQPFSISHQLSVIIHQVIYYNLDSDFISANLFPILIQFSHIQPQEINETFNNPAYYIGQFMKFGPYPSTFNSRVTSATVIYDLVHNHNIDQEAILPHLLPNDEDEINVIESKLYLITALVKALLQKQSAEDSEKRIKAKRKKIKLPPFHFRLPVPPEVVDIVEQIIVSDPPTFVLISALHLYSKLAPFTNVEKGAEIGTTAICSEANDATIINYGAKLFSSCVDKLQSTDGIDYSSILQPIIECAKVVRSKTLSGVIAKLANKNPDAMLQYAQAVIEAFVDVINDQISLESVDIENINRVEDALNSIFSILDPNRKNVELLESLYSFVIGNLIEVLRVLNIQFDLEKLFLIFGLFSMNFKVHPAAFYESFIRVFEVFNEEQELLQQVVMCAMNQFVWYAYPLLVDQNGENPYPDEFRECVLNVVRVSREILSDPDMVSMCHEDSTPYALFFMSCATQVYGVDPEVLGFAQNSLHSIMEYMNLPGYSIPEHTIVAAVRIFSAAAMHDPEIIAPIRDDRDLMSFLSTRLNYQFFNTYWDMKACFVFLLSLARIGDADAFAAAVMNLPKMAELKIRDEAEEKEEEAEEVNEANEVNEEVIDDDAEDAPVEEEDVDDICVMRLICFYHCPADLLDEKAILRSVIEAAPALAESLNDELKAVLSQYLSN